MPNRTVYKTRIDRFRASQRIDLPQWQRDASVARTQMVRYRSGATEPRSDILARLVRSAARLLNRPVRAAELYDLGENEPLGVRQARANASGVRGRYDTRLDRRLRRHGIVGVELAAKARMSRQNIRKLRAGLEKPRVSTIARLVRALRRMGLDVAAGDLFDVGED